MPDFRSIPRRDYLLALLSGTLLAFSFPRPGISIFAWGAFVPLFLACGKKSPQGSFRLGFVAGLAGYGGILYWVNIVMTTYGKLPLPVSVVMYLLLTAYLALYPAIFVWVMKIGEHWGITPLLSAPIIWTALEYCRSMLLTGFPWANLGHSQYRTLPLIQIADVTGVYGLSFLIMLANIILYRIIRGIVKGEREGYPAKTALVFLVLMGLVFWYGFVRLNTPETGRPMKIALLQGNIPQDVKWDPSFQEATVGIYERLSREACAAGAELVIWPESAAPFYIQDDVNYTGRIQQLSRTLRTCMVIGSPAYEKGEKGLRYLNSAFLFGPTGEILGRSDKVHLVPFGEYVPLAWMFPFVNKMVEGIGDFSPGKGTVPLNTGKGEIGILVCFEGIFPELARGYVKNGARLLVNITNDAWFGRSSAPYQHLSMTVFRAVENRVPLVRAANTGITAIIDSKGHIQGMTPLFEETHLNGEIRLGEGGTFYVRYGDVFALTTVIASLAIAAIVYRKQRDRRI